MVDTLALGFGGLGLGGEGRLRAGAIHAAHQRYAGDPVRRTHVPIMQRLHLGLLESKVTGHAASLLGGAGSHARTSRETRAASPLKYRAGSAIEAASEPASSDAE